MDGLFVLEVQVLSRNYYATGIRVVSCNYFLESNGQRLLANQNWVNELDFYDANSP